MASEKNLPSISGKNYYFDSLLGRSSCFNSSVGALSFGSSADLSQFLQNFHFDSLLRQECLVFNFFRYFPSLSSADALIQAFSVVSSTHSLEPGASSAEASSIEASAVVSVAHSVASQLTYCHSAILFGFTAISKFL